MYVWIFVERKLSPSPDDILFYRKSIADLTFPAQTIVVHDIINNVHRREIKASVRPLL